MTLDERIEEIRKQLETEPRVCARCGFFWRMCCTIQSAASPRHEYERSRSVADELLEYLDKLRDADLAQWELLADDFGDTESED